MRKVFYVLIVYVKVHLLAYVENGTTLTSTGTVECLKKENLIKEEKIQSWYWVILSFKI